MKKNRILVVDDEVDILDLLKEYLEMFEQEVTTTNDPYEALEIIKERLNTDSSIDVVFTDQNMPGMEGTELSVKIGDISKDIKVALLSGIKEDERDICGKNIIKAIEKPFTIDDFKEVLS
ncbi:MAG: hypothetical protein CR982_02180 [Candidatus Cloacimonadota bacterium]|nr:MAG: hypothetical protein CR982_02180 [Candidatus Cloacimonadota bacterium]PIE81121.1 MAG: hypothetical protein CSA15_01210 [Candidatus Delongbacteria bacterium]